jgi:NAD+ kinase
MKQPPPRSIGIVANSGKPSARQTVSELTRLLDARRVPYLFESGTAKMMRRGRDGRPLRQVGRKVDMVVVLGGDGTILRAARELEDAAPLVLGINIGGLGFLTGIRCAEMATSLDNILQGRFAISTRHTLLATVLRQGREPEAHQALNDAVISRSAFSRVVRLRLNLDGALLTDYVCDGMIFATATGSTAYSLSAGGPILLPTTDAWIVTPICPHALSNRSVIVGRHSVLRCEPRSAAGDLLLTVDGQVQVRLRIGDEVEVRPGSRQVRLVVTEGHSYFDVLRQKLKWSGANV